MSDAKRPHAKACLRCGGDMTDGQLRRQDFDEKHHDETMAELDSTYCHLRAVIENCRHSSVDAVRHQLVGLLPEARDFEPEVKEQMRAGGMADLVDIQAERVRQAWADYGYGGAA